MKLLNEKFEQKKKPILDKRDQILEGTLEDFAEYMETFSQYDQKLQEFCSSIVKDEPQQQEELEEAKKREPFDSSPLVGQKGVPDFWYKSLYNNPMTKQLILEHDEPILKNITSLKVSQTRVPENKITVEMTFANNEFFSNVNLSFTAVIDEDEDCCKEVIGDTIDWKEGKDVTKKKIKKTQKNKKTNQKRVITKTVPQDSFFNLFESKKQPENPDSDGEDSEEEKLLQGLQENQEFATDLYDMYMGEALEHYLWPDTDDLSALLGARGMGGEDDDSEGDDDDTKESKSKSKKDKSDKSDASKGGAEGAGGKGKEECKQQ